MRSILIRVRLISSELRIILIIIGMILIIDILRTLCYHKAIIPLTNRLLTILYTVSIKIVQNMVVYLLVGLTEYYKMIKQFLILFFGIISLHN